MNVTTTVGDDDLVSALRVSGMSLYEARIYIGLLRHGVQNGNELSRTARVPSSKVYGVLGKLADAAIVHPIHGSDGTRFSAVAPHELIDRLRRRYNDPLDLLEQALPQLSAPPGTTAVLAIGSRNALLASFVALLQGAVREVNTSLWASELGALPDQLTAAHDRGVQIYGMLYSDGGDVDLPGSWLRHGYETVVETRLRGRMLTLVADREEVVVAHLPANSDVVVGVRTRSAPVVLLALEYLHHDRVLQAAQQKMGFDEWDRWWQADAELRDIISASRWRLPQWSPAEPHPTADTRFEP